MKKTFELFNGKTRTIYYENSLGDWSKSEFDSNGNEIYHENSSSYWNKYEYDNNGNVIYHENSDRGIIRDKRIKQIELTLDQIAEKFGISINQLKIKK